MKRHIKKTVHPITLFFFFFCSLTNVNAQNIAIEDDRACINCANLTAHSSAALEVRSTNKGMLIPRVSNTSSIANPAEGLMIYDNFDNDFKFYDGSKWQGGLRHISFRAIANTFVGIYAGFSNTTGTNNIANGYYAFYSNTTGSSNTANGSYALYSNTTGGGNTANGFRALYANTIGNDNTANGNNALRSNTIGVNNTANGNSALYVNTTGSSNTANGNNALYSNTTGGGNTASGSSALYSNTTGDSNIAIGSSALTANTTGSNNIVIGRNALFSNTTESYNTAIGSATFTNVYNANNSTAIGYQAQPTGSNQVRLGNNAVTSIGGYANWSNISDARFKTQVQDNVPGLAFISQLNPVTYQMDMDAIAKFHQTSDELRLKDSERAKSAIRYTGFLAQDVEKAAESIGYDFSGVEAPQHDKDNYSLRYAEFVVPLVKAVQELDTENKALRTQNADLEARLERIESLLRQRTD